MKIVISSSGPSATDAVDPRFGRAAWFVRYDSALETFSSVDNRQAVDAVQGAGVRAAQLVAGQDAEVLLTGHCGPKAFDILSAAGVEIYSGLEGTVLEAIRAWQKGDLKPLAAPDGLGKH